MGSGDKGFISGNMQFGVSDEELPPEVSDGPVMPLRLLAICDLVPTEEHNAGANAPEDPIRVDLSEPDDLFRRIRPRVSIEVPSVLADGQTVRVELAPKSLKSFRPDEMIQEIGLLSSLMEGRRVLERVRDGSLTLEGAAQQLDRMWKGSPFAREVVGESVDRPAPAPSPAPAASAPASSGGAEVDSLLDMVDLGGSSGDDNSAPILPGGPPIAADVPDDRLSAVITAVAKAARGGSSGGKTPTAAINRVEKAIGVQLGAILQHPEVRRLEQAYRGVGFLASRAKTQGLLLDVLSCRKEDVVSAFARAAKSGEVPVSVAIIDTDVDGTAAGFAQLAELADIAEGHTIPIIVNGSPRLLQENNFERLDKLDNKKALFEAKEQTPWRSAAYKLWSRWVTIAINPFLARAPYDKRTSRIREAAIVEHPNEESGFVWTAPAWGVGTLIAQSFAKTGWPCRIVGARDGGLLEDLPVVEREVDGRETAIPTQAFISTDTQKELSRIGILALAASHNSDMVYVMNAPTMYVTPPKRTYDGASTDPEIRLDPVSLVDQLFVARLAQFLRALCAKIPANSDPAEIQPVLEGAVWTLFENGAPAGPQIDLKVKDDDGLVAAIVVRPRRFLGVAIEEIAMDVPIG